MSKKRNTPGLWPSANCPEFLQALYQFAPRGTGVLIPPHKNNWKKKLTSDVTAVIRSIRKIHRHLDVRELFRRKGVIIEIAIPHLVGSLKVIDAGIQVVELQRYEIRSRIDLQFRKSRECEVCRETQEPSWDGGVPVTGRWRQW